MKKGEKNEAFLAWVKSDLSKKRSLLRGISTLLYRDMGYGGGIFLADFADRDGFFEAGGAFYRS